MAKCAIWCCHTHTHTYTQRVAGIQTHRSKSGRQAVAGWHLGLSEQRRLRPSFGPTRSSVRPASVGRFVPLAANWDMIRFGGGGAPDFETLWYSALVPNAKRFSNLLSIRLGHLLDPSMDWSDRIVWDNCDLMLIRNHCSTVNSFFRIMAYERLTIPILPQLKVGIQNSYSGT